MFGINRKIMSGENNGSIWVTLDRYKDSRKMIICVIYLTLLLDNVLLTMVVPIVPDFLLNEDRIEKQSHNQEYRNSYRNQLMIHPSLTKDRKYNSTIDNKHEKEEDNYKNFDIGIETEAYMLDIDSENGRVGLLLSSKAIVQLLLNPFVGIITAKLGYHLPLFFGTSALLISAILFALGEGFATLFLARSLQGIASSCIGVTGMCLVAERYPNEPERSKMMGFVLGSVAVGVLLGYPLGGFMYDFLGKSAPFIIVGILIFLDGALQFYALDLKPVEEEFRENTEWCALLSDNLILLTGGAIGISTSAMAILEPCLPLWLLVQIKPKKWQLGTAFIPDSIGYVVGTNSFGMVAYHVGRSKVAIVAMMLVGISSILIPVAKTMFQLILPHFLLGLGIGAVDAALVPLLASLVDTRHSAHYGSVYALQQMAVCLAYSLGPVIGGEVVRAVGFPWLMRCVGLINLIYSPFLIFLGHPSDQNTPLNKENVVDYRTESRSHYQQFTESEESE